MERLNNLNEAIEQNIRECLIEQIANERSNKVFIGHNNKAKCYGCGYEGTKNDILKNNSRCPKCNAPMNKNFNHAKEGTTLVIEKTKMGNIVFRFFSVFLSQNVSDIKQEIIEEYRIFKSADDVVVYKKQKSGNFAKTNSKEIRNYSFRNPDILGFHSFSNFAENDDFVQSLDFLFDDSLSMKSVFDKILVSAKTYSITNKCPDFQKALPSNSELIARRKAPVEIKNHYNVTSIGVNYKCDFWCGHCGKYHEFYSETNNAWEINRYKCDCKESAKRTLISPNLFIDVERNIDNTVVRFVKYYVKQTPMPNSVVNQTASFMLVPKISQVCYGVFYQNGEYALYDNNKTPLFDLSAISNNKTELVNSEIIEILENDQFVAKTKFVEYCKQIGIWNEDFLISKQKTEIVDELIDAGFARVLKDILHSEVSKLPNFLLKKKNFNLSTFSVEQLEDLKQLKVGVKNFILFLNLIKKDNTAKLSDFLTVMNLGPQNTINDIIQKIPNAKISKIKDYILRIRNEECCYPKEMIPIWASYLKRATKVKMDLSVEENAYPKNLKKSNDMLARRNIVFEFSKNFEKEFYNRVDQIKNTTLKFEDFTIRPVCSIEEYYNFCDELLFTEIPNKYLLGRWNFVVLKNQKPVALFDCYSLELKNGEIEKGSMYCAKTFYSQTITFGANTNDNQDFEDIKEVIFEFCITNNITIG